MEALEAFFEDELASIKNSRCFRCRRGRFRRRQGSIPLEHKTTKAKSAVYNVSALGWKTNVEMMIAVDEDLTLRGYAFVTNGGTEGIGLTMIGATLNLADNIPIADAVIDYDAVGGVSAPVTGEGVKDCFRLVAQRANTDLGVNEMTVKENFLKGFVKENPLLVQVWDCVRRWP